MAVAVAVLVAVIVALVGDILRELLGGLDDLVWGGGVNHLQAEAESVELGQRIDGFYWLPLVLHLGGAGRVDEVPLRFAPNRWFIPVFSTTRTGAKWILVDPQ